MKDTVSGVMLTLLVLALLMSVLNVRPVEAWTGTIYIKADGSVDPPTVPLQRDGDIYTFTDSIDSEKGIVIERNNMTLDGAGYTLRNIPDFDSAVGIWLSKTNNVTVKNTKIEDFTYDIHLERSSNNSIVENHIRSVRLQSSNYNNISGNSIESGIWCIYTVNSSHNIISRNSIVGGFWSGIYLKDKSLNNLFYHNNFIDTVVLSHRSEVNSWDNGYPSGGNYWSSYRNSDFFSGPFQNETGSDGIGDACYGKDRYPLVFAVDSPPTSPVVELQVESGAGIMRVGEPLAFKVSFLLPGWNGTHVSPIKEYRWDFGDGNTTSTIDRLIAHTYTRSNTYDVRLTAVDSQGFSSSYSSSVKLWMPVSVSVSTGASSTFVGFAVDLNGTLQNIYGDGLHGETVVLYYTFQGANVWVPISSDTTDHLGKYSISWIPSATGYFTIKAEWTGNSTHLGANNSISLSSIPYQNQYVFSVESNSTISTLAFNATSWELSFIANGQTGTKGYVKVTIAKSLVENIADVKVYLDRDQIDYTTTLLSDSWLLHLTYLHSTHKITINLGQLSAPFIETPLGKVLIYGVPIAAMVILVLFLLRKSLRARAKQVVFTNSETT